MGSIHENHDWESIQKEYDTGKTTEEVRKLFSISTRGMAWGSKNRKLIVRNQSERTALVLKKCPRFHSEKTKKKISKIRLKYLNENPNKVPYLINHSSHKSWPEEVFETALKTSKIIGWEPRFRNGIYQYDIAFPIEKIDVEIDGGTHLTEKVIKIDKRRDAWSKSQGWKVIRFTAKRVKEDVSGCIEELKNLLLRHE